MTAQTVLDTLAARGVHVRVAGAQLAVRPAAALTPELRALIAAHRDALLATLAAPAAQASRDDAVEARRLVFVQQIVAAGSGPIPALCYQPHRPYTSSGCSSCGERLAEGDGSFGRCRCCGDAARLALARFPLGAVR